MRVYDLVTSEYNEYKYALTFDELLNREIDINKKIYTTTGCISEGNSTKAKADYIAINPLYMLKERDKNVKIILRQHEYSADNINLLPCDYVAVYYNFNDYYKLNYNSVDTGNILDCLKRFTYFTNDKNVYDKLVADQNIQAKQCTIELNNDTCKRINSLCQNNITFSMGIELLANCYVKNMPLACIIIATNYYNYKKAQNKLSKKGNLLMKTMLTNNGYQKEYFKDVCIAFKQCTHEQLAMLNRLYYSNNFFNEDDKLTINEILDEWD